MKRQFGIFAALAAMMAMSSAQGAATATGTIDKGAHINTTALRTQSKKEFLRADGANPRRYIRTPKANQRQYRKWLRQNPHMRRSKKTK